MITCCSKSANKKVPFKEQEWSERWTWNCQIKRESSCSTAVEHTPVEKNSWDRGFKSHQVLVFSSLFVILLVVHPEFRSLIEVQHFWFSKKNKLGCEAWGEARLIRMDWQKMFKFFKLHSEVLAFLNHNYDPIALGSNSSVSLASFLKDILMMILFFAMKLFLDLWKWKKRFQLEGI